VVIEVRRGGCSGSKGRGNGDRGKRRVRVFSGSTAPKLKGVWLHNHILSGSSWTRNGVMVRNPVRVRVGAMFRAELGSGLWLGNVTQTFCRHADVHVHVPRHPSVVAGRLCVEG